MALSVDDIKAIAVEEIKTSFTRTNVPVGAKVEQGQGPDGKVTFKVTQTLGTFTPDDDGVRLLADAIANTLHRVLTELAEVEVTEVAGKTTGGTVVEGKGVGKIK